MHKYISPYLTQCLLKASEICFTVGIGEDDFNFLLNYIAKQGRWAKWKSFQGHWSLPLTSYLFFYERIWHLPVEPQICCWTKSHFVDDVYALDEFCVIILKTLNFNFPLINFSLWYIIQITKILSWWIFFKLSVLGYAVLKIRHKTKVPRYAVSKSNCVFRISLVLQQP